ncbi:MAG: hypothetical protein ACOC2U_02915 [bacterium]
MITLNILYSFISATNNPNNIPLYTLDKPTNLTPKKLLCLNRGKYEVEFISVYTRDFRVTLSKYTNCAEIVTLFLELFRKEMDLK